MNTLRDPAYDNPVGTVWMTEDGQCYDEMNRNLWVVTFNTLMQVRVECRTAAQGTSYFCGNKGASLCRTMASHGTHRYQVGC